MRPIATAAPPIGGAQRPHDAEIGQAGRGLRVAPRGTVDASTRASQSLGPKRSTPVRSSTSTDRRELSTDHRLAGAPRDVAATARRRARCRRDLEPRLGRSLAHCARLAPPRVRRSSRSRSITASTTAGAWIIRLCRSRSLSLRRSGFGRSGAAERDWPERQAARSAASARRSRPRAARLHQRAHRPHAAESARRAADDADASADLLGGSLVDVPPSARLPRLRRRRRHRRRAGHFGRRGAGAEKLRPAAGRRLRRRRLSDGRDRGVDGGALQNSAAVRHRQQSLVLQ